MIFGDAKLVRVESIVVVMLPAAGRYLVEMGFSQNE